MMKMEMKGLILNNENKMIHNQLFSTALLTESIVEIVRTILNS